MLEKEVNNLLIAGGKKHLEMNGPMEDTQAEICPETEMECLECVEKNGQRKDAEEHDKIIPDLLSPEENICIFESISNMMPRQNALRLLWSLNEKQCLVLENFDNRLDFNG